MTLALCRLGAAGPLHTYPPRALHISRQSIRVPRHIRRGLASLHAVVGIDLGTSNSAIGIVDQGQAKIVATSDGSITNSWVAFTEVTCLSNSCVILCIHSSVTYL